jgi:hypothetical protein
VLHAAALICLGGFFHDLADLRLADNPRRHHNKRIACGMQEKSEVAERSLHCRKTTFCASCPAWPVFLTRRACRFRSA